MGLLCQTYGQLTVTVIFNSPLPLSKSANELTVIIENILQTVISQTILHILNEDYFLKMHHNIMHYVSTL